MAEHIERGHSSRFDRRWNHCIDSPLTEHVKRFGAVACRVHTLDGLDKSSTRDTLTQVSLASKMRLEAMLPALTNAEACSLWLL